jgi:hypothetical protein
VYRSEQDGLGMGQALQQQLVAIRRPVSGSAGAVSPPILVDGGFWSPQLELDLDVVGYYSLISLPLGHAAAEQALQMADKRGAMKFLTGKVNQPCTASMRL